MCGWWSTEILCIGASSWREPLWVVCAPSWNDRSRVWSIWNKVKERRRCLLTEMLLDVCRTLDQSDQRFNLNFNNLSVVSLQQCVSICPVCRPLIQTQGPCFCAVTPTSASPVSSTRWAALYESEMFLSQPWWCFSPSTSLCLMHYVNDLPRQVTRADVDVQPYAFTTKSLFVGHMDYRYLRWQVTAVILSMHVCSFASDVFVWLSKLSYEPWG